MRTSSFASALASLLFLLPACGDDSGGGGGDVPDGPVIDDVDGPPIEVPDAPPGIDAGPTADAREDFTGLDQPCCDPTGMCENEMVCLIGLATQSCGPDPEPDPGGIDAGGGGVCRPTCMPGVVGQCPFPSQCRMFSGGFGVCLAAVGDDEPCGAGIRCADGFLCVDTGVSGNEHFCREICTSQEQCDTGETCTTVTSDQMVCLPT